MITVAGTDKALSEMTEDELAVIVANCTHTLKRRRYSNEAHRHYLESRVEACRQEMTGRK